MVHICQISSREIERSDQFALRRFTCCERGAPSYALDVQRYIRGLNLGSTIPGVHRMVLYCRGDSDLYGFCEFGYDDSLGADSGYAISFVATGSRYQGHGLGHMIIDCVLRWISNDAAVSGRRPYVATQIDADNDASVRLFSDMGFEDEGVDSYDPGYHVWSRTFEPVARDDLWLFQTVMF
ncbi:GNAT family N-acetyltransferase [Bifidobacterium sp. 6T3]|uniref:GNAT family N-acetyltransferase n=2 Tax=Bifidobacterium phasiani TaxID=2834431 RepID=A0ABS6W9J0_9BIFI|nr:GNAT family N-acetyltransferase [Bifidobacterium phasiani]